MERPVDEGVAPRRPRLWLLGAFLTAVVALALLNASGPVRSLANFTAPLLGGAASTLVRLVPSPNEVRVIRPDWLRRGANRAAGPVRVGLQVGHLHASEQPDELADLRYSTGGHANGFDEVDANLAVGEALAERLEARGFEVDLLPATVPPGYSADLVLSLHADSSPDPRRSGYKSAHFVPARNPHEAILKVAVDRAMLLGTGMDDDDRNVSGNMLQYYAFNHRRFRHSVARSTPALIVELGYLSHPQDLRLLRRPDELAAALERGVLGYLRDIGRLEGAW